MDGPRGRKAARAATAALAALAMACSSGGGSVAPDPASLPEAKADDYGPSASPEPGATRVPDGSGASASAGASEAPAGGPSPSGPAAVRATESAPRGGTRPTAGATATSGARPTSKATATAAPAKRVWVDTSCRQNASEIGDGNAMAGHRPPDFVGTTTDCKRLGYGSFTDGRPHLVTFYATWCKPCREEAPHIQDLYTEWRPKNGFTVVAILTSDAKGDPSDFYTEYGWTFPSVWDDGEDILHAWDRKSAALGTLPISYWVHSDGTVSEVVVGGMTRESMQRSAEKLR